MADIFVAPFSNSDIRDWPAGHYARLLGLLVEHHPDSGIAVIGTANQRLAANEIVRGQPAPQVENLCGRLSWAEVEQRLSHAYCVIGNNSGIAHVSAAMGTPTVCVFGGSHQRSEWHPRGPRVVIVSRVIGCSPCHLDHNSGSPYGKACLRDIAPEEVARAVRLVTTRPPESLDFDFGGQFLIPAGERA